MTNNYQYANLRRRSFKGEELRGADFSHADIRGVNFRGVMLIGANFGQCRAGLPTHWVIGLIVGALLLATCAGFITGFAGAFIDFVWQSSRGNLTAIQQQILALLTVVMVVVFFGILLRRGLGAALSTFVLTVTMIMALVMALATVKVVVSTLLLMVCIAAAAASVIALAASIAIIIGATDIHLTWAVLVAATIGAIPGVGEGLEGVITKEAVGHGLLITWLLSSVGTIVLLAIGAHIGRQVMLGDKRYALIRVLVIALLTKGGTSFHSADLTDADFTAATLRNSDLREAAMTRTNWLQAKDLDRARTEKTYLAYAQIRQLAITKDGNAQDFSYLNLQGLNLAGAKLTDANFNGANLGAATLEAADLTRAKLAHTQLHDTDLRGANLTGAYIEDWGISTNTLFSNIRCDYVYMRLPTRQEPDPWRKPDNKAETFQEGDFADFIAPIIKTLDLYRRQDIDPRELGRAYKTLDLFHYDTIDPSASAIALKQLAEQYPEARLAVVALEGLYKEKIRLQATVSEQTDRSVLSARYTAIYEKLIALPQQARQALMAELMQQDARIANLANFVRTASQSDKIFIETRIHLGGAMVEQVTCLFLAANPSGTQPLNLAREIREIKAKIRAAEYRDAVNLVSEWAVRPDDLLQSLNTYKPQIVHFSGHGTDAGEIILEDEQGGAKPVSAQALKALFTTLKDNIKLVILNACYSDIQAQALVEVIDCVIGMRSTITDQAAILFVASLYRAIGFGRSIQEAFDQGIVALLVEGVSEADKPQLLRRSSVDATLITLIKIVNG